MPKAHKRYMLSRRADEAREKLLSYCKFLDGHNIPYHLEGGTLLGIVRDGDLLPWDHDLDISIPYEYRDKVLALSSSFLFKLGTRISAHKVPGKFVPYIDREVYMVRIKPVLEYYLQWFRPKHDMIVLDIFFKKKDETYTYWLAKKKLMRVENKHYESHEVLKFQGYDFKAPNHYKEYLTKKYGDWSVPVKEWDCAKNELTIIRLPTDRK